MNINKDLGTVLIAGAAGGIGAEIVRQLAPRAGRMILISRRKEQLTELSAWLPAELPVDTMEVDVSESDCWKAVAASTVSGVDQLVYVVGSVVTAPLAETSLGDIAAVMDANFYGLLHCLKTMLPLMRGGASVVVIGSAGGVVPLPNEAVYCASKAAVRLLLLSLREEYRAADIHFSLISAGPVDTDMLRGIAPCPSSALTFSLSLLTPSEIAHAVERAIGKRKAEWVLPRSTAWLVLLAGAFPRFYSFLRPVFAALGEWRRRRYLNAQEGTIFTRQIGPESEALLRIFSHETR